MRLIRWLHMIHPLSKFTCKRTASTARSEFGVGRFLRKGRREALLEFKEALDAFENTTKMVLLRSFAPPGSMEVTDPDADTKQQLDATIAKLDDGLEYSRAATMSILVDVFGRDQVDS